MAKTRIHNYAKIGGTILLDREEQWLREEGAKTLEDVERYYDRHYPHASSAARDVVTAELFSRLQTETEVGISSCRLPTADAKLRNAVRRNVRWKM